MLTEKEREIAAEQTSTEEGSGSNGAPATEPETRAEEPQAEPEAAPSELEKALAEKQELLDKFQRAQAEFENARKRLQREQDEFRQYAALDTIEALLPIVDDFERAIEAPGLDQEVKKGLELIHNRIVDVLTRAGLQPVDAEGHFDPNVHQAVDRGKAETDGEDQKILEVYQKGYLYKEKLLRPAMVKVAVKE